MFSRENMGRFNHFGIGKGIMHASVREENTRQTQSSGLQPTKPESYGKDEENQEQLLLFPYNRISKREKSSSSRRHSLVDYMRLRKKRQEEVSSLPTANSPSLRSSNPEANPYRYLLL